LREAIEKAHFRLASALYYLGIVDALDLEERVIAYVGCSCVKMPSIDLGAKPLSKFERWLCSQRIAFHKNH
jgi:hypothetical protein